MPGWLFAVIVVAFLVGGVLYVRSKQKGAFVERFPLADGEAAILEEEGLKVFHRARKLAVRGGGTTTYRVRSLLTDRRIFVATGGPEGEHKLVIQMVLDYTTPAEPVPGSGFSAYKRKFPVGKGYPTYCFTAADATLENGALRVDVPFPEGGPRWGPQPEVKLYTA